MDLKQTYNTIAEDWVKDHEPDTWWIQGTDVFIGFLQPQAKVLDVGCGGGQKALYLLDKGFRVTGIDFSEKMIEIARRRVPGVPFQVMDMRDLSGLPEQYDGILAQASLLHIPKNEIPSVLDQLRSKLTAGGYLYIAVKEIQSDQIEERVIEEHDYGAPYTRFFSFFSSEELSASVERAGMTVCFLDVLQSGKTRWIQLIAQK